MADNKANSPLPVNPASGNTEVANITAQDEEHQYLTFSLGSDLYAFGILNVKEILGFHKVTTVPMVPDFIQGVINLRGEVVPVINLAKRFQLTCNEITKRTCIVIVEVNNGEKSHDLGVMVDSVSEVLEIQPQDIKPTPNFGVKIRTDFIFGMGKLDEDFVIILDENRVLSIDELAIVEQVANYANGG